MPDQESMMGERKTVKDRTQQEWCVVLADCLLTGKPGDLPLIVKDIFAQSHRQAEAKPIKLSPSDAEAMSITDLLTILGRECRTIVVGYTTKESYWLDPDCARTHMTGTFPEMTGLCQILKQQSKGKVQRLLDAEAPCDDVVRERDDA